MTFERGVTLLESLIAMTILTIAGFAALKLFSYLEIERANSALFAKASFLAQNQISILQQANTSFVCPDGRLINFHQIESCKITLSSLFPIL